MRYNSRNLSEDEDAAEGGGQAGPGADQSGGQQTGIVDTGPAASAPVREAVQRAERIADETGGLGRPGRPVNRRSPFFIGMTATAGVAITVAVIELLLKAGSVLTLIGMALFIADRDGASPASTASSRNCARLTAPSRISMLCRATPASTRVTACSASTCSAGFCRGSGELSIPGIVVSPADGIS
jgi:hypothetical protein